MTTKTKWKTHTHTKIFQALVKNLPNVYKNQKCVQKFMKTRLKLPSYNTDYRSHNKMIIGK